MGMIENFALFFIKDVGVGFCQLHFHILQFLFHILQLSFRTRLIYDCLFVFWVFFFLRGVFFFLIRDFLVYGYHPFFFYLINAFFVKADIFFHTQYILTMIKENYSRSIYDFVQRYSTYNIKQVFKNNEIWQSAIEQIYAIFVKASVTMLLFLNSVFFGPSAL